MLEHVGPFSAGSGVAMLEVLPEVVRPEELFRLIALAKLVLDFEVLEPRRPIWWIDELVAAVAALICRTVATEGDVEGLLALLQGGASP